MHFLYGIEKKPLRVVIRHNHCTLHILIPALIILYAITTKQSKHDNYDYKCPIRPLRNHKCHIIYTKDNCTFLITGNIIYFKGNSKMLEKRKYDVYNILQDTHSYIWLNSWMNGKWYFFDHSWVFLSFYLM